MLENMTMLVDSRISCIKILWRKKQASQLIDALSCFYHSATFNNCADIWYLSESQGIWEEFYQGLQNFFQTWFFSVNASLQYWLIN